MSERVRNTTTHRRIGPAAALASLLLALLVQSIPHVHELAPGSVSLESADAASIPASAVIDGGGCVACRMGSARIGFAGGGASLHLLAPEPAHALTDEATPGLISRLLHAAAPPRAPPV